MIRETEGDRITWLKIFRSEVRMSLNVIIWISLLTFIAFLLVKT